MNNQILMFFKRSTYRIGHAPDTELDAGVLVIGTDPGDWAEGREQWIAAREALTHTMEVLRLEAGEEPQGYEEGSMG